MHNHRKKGVQQQRAKTENKGGKMGKWNDVIEVGRRVGDEDYRVCVRACVCMCLLCGVSVCL